MNILTARLSNAEGSVVEASTAEAGNVLIPVSGPDHSGGWQVVYGKWLQQGGQVRPFVEPVRESSEAFMLRHGFGIFQLLDLKDLEDKLRAASIEIPVKALSLRAWIDSVRASYFSNEPPGNPPHSYQEVVQETLQKLS